MVGYRAALRGEMYLILRSRVVRWAIAATAIVSLAYALHGRLESLLATARNLGASGGQASGPAESAFVPFVDGLSSGCFLGGFLLLALAAGSLAWDRDQGVARLFLIRRSSREALVLAKLSALSLLGAALLLVVLLSSWGCAALLGDFGPIVERGYEIYATGEVRSEVWMGLAATAAPLLAAIAFGLLVSACARSTAGAVAIALLAVLALQAFTDILGGASKWIFTSYLPGPAGGGYLREVTWKVARGYSDIVFTGRDLLLNFLVPSLEAAVFTGLALWVTARRRI